jgi:DNA-binding NarL/FixJ family response regulator
MNQMRILLADDHPYFSEFVEGLLGPAFEIVQKVRDGRALIDAALKLKPDLIITDISMPVLNGIDAVDELRKSGCISRIVFLTVHSDPEFIRECLAAGAYGYVFKERVTIDLPPAVHEALAGHIFISPHESN